MQPADRTGFVPVPGQVVATVSTLESFVPRESLTLRMRSGHASAAFGEVRATYAVWPAPGGGSRVIGVMHCAEVVGATTAQRRAPRPG